MANPKVVSESYLPPLLEGLRAISGLGVVVALLGLVALTPLPRGFAGGEAFLQAQSLSSAAPPDITTTPMISNLAQQSHLMGPTPGQSQQPPTKVFYLVCTPYEEEIANQGESTLVSSSAATNSARRSYRILYACDDAQLQKATRIVMNYMLGSNDGTDVQLIDLRGVR